jgi:hypothetical protein
MMRVRVSMRFTMGLKAVGRVIRVSACILLAYDNVLSFYIGQEKNDALEGEHVVHNGPEGSGEGDKGECMHSSCL